MSAFLALEFSVIRPKLDAPPRTCGDYLKDRDGCIQRYKKQNRQVHGSYANTGTELTLGDLVSCLQDFKIGAVFKKEQHSEPAKHEKILC